MVSTSVNPMSSLGFSSFWSPPRPAVNLCDMQFRRTPGATAGGALMTDNPIGQRPLLGANKGALPPIGEPIYRYPSSSSSSDEFDSLVDDLGGLNFHQSESRKLDPFSPEGGLGHRLHVSNIPFAFTDGDLKTIFEDFGKVLHQEVIYNEKGSKGFGFVTMASRREAMLAKRYLHGALCQGRIIEVNDAIPKQKAREMAAKRRAQQAVQVAQFRFGQIVYAPNLPTIPSYAAVQRNSSAPQLQQNTPPEDKGLLGHYSWQPPLQRTGGDLIDFEQVLLPADLVNDVLH